jgi:hypothetical protein
MLLIDCCTCPSHRAQEALRLERNRREKSELELQDLSRRHTAVLGKLEVLQRSVEILQYEKELQKGIEEEARRLGGALKEAHILAKALLDDVRPCSADVQAQTEVFRSYMAEASKREMLQKKLREVCFPCFALPHSI